MIKYVIHDMRRPDIEWIRCIEELERQGITGYIQWPAYTGGITVEASISQSHKSIVREAREKRLPQVCIMESDVWFPEMGSWLWFEINMPKKFDLYLAGSYQQNMTQLRTSSLFGHEHRIAHPVGFHCYVIDKGYYEQFLDTPDDCHIDAAQEGGEYYVCYPFAAIQHPGWSANAKKDDVDYNTDLIPQDVFGGLPLK